MNPGAILALVQGGPISSDSADSGFITCSIHLNGPLHSDPDVPLGTPSAPDVLPPTLLVFQATPFNSVYICTEWTEEHTTYYYDAPSNRFTTSSSARCAFANLVTDDSNTIWVAAPEVHVPPIG